MDTVTGYSHAIGAFAPASKDRYFVTPAIIAEAEAPIPCILLQTFYDGDEDPQNPLDHKVAYTAADKHGKLRARTVYIEPEHLFETEAAANEYIADQIAKRLRKLTRQQSRRLRPLRELTSEYDTKKRPLKCLLQKAEKRLVKPTDLGCVNSPAASTEPCDIVTSGKEKVQRATKPLFAHSTQEAA